MKSDGAVRFVEVSTVCDETATPAMKRVTDVPPRTTAQCCQTVCTGAYVDEAGFPNTHSVTPAGESDTARVDEKEKITGA